MASPAKQLRRKSAVERLENTVVQYQASLKEEKDHVTTVKVNNNNQLPPQFLERVKFIDLEDQQPISLSKRSNDFMF